LNGLFALPGETNATLTIPNAQPGNEGSYSVLVTNIAGEVRSAPAILRVLVSPAIVTQPQSQSAATGATVEFAVVATGSLPLAYQWFLHEAVPLLNATNAALQLVNVQPGDSGGYSVVVSNDAGAITSSVATLTVAGTLAIVTQPRNLTVPNGSAAQFTVVAAGDPPLFYQWFFNGSTTLPIATNATLNLSNVTLADMGAYTVRVSNPSGAVTSAPASLRVLVSVPGIVLNLNNPVTLSFETVAGLRYTVEFKDDLNSPTWNITPGSAKLKGNGVVM